MKFDKPKGQRLHKQFWAITTYPSMWYIPSERKWVENYLDCKDWAGASTHYGCKTLRAFRRHLRKHPEIKGHATLVNRFRGYDIHG